MAHHDNESLPMPDGNMPEVSQLVPQPLPRVSRQLANDDDEFQNHFIIKKIAEKAGRRDGIGEGHLQPEVHSYKPKPKPNTDGTESEHGTKKSRPTTPVSVQSLIAKFNKVASLKTEEVAKPVPRKRLENHVRDRYSVQVPNERLPQRPVTSPQLTENQSALPVPVPISPEVETSKPQKHKAVGEEPNEEKKDPMVSKKVPLSPFLLPKGNARQPNKLPSACALRSPLMRDEKPLGLFKTGSSSSVVDMSSIKNMRDNNPHTGAAFIVKKPTFVQTTSPMDQRYPPIQKYLEPADMAWKTPEVDESFKSAVFRICQQSLPIPLDLIFSGFKNIHKIGEGVFGEVFVGSFLNQMRVYKVVPIEGTAKVNGEKQKTYQEIYPELAISIQLSKLQDGIRGCQTDGFVRVHSTRIGQGTYPNRLVETWKAWDKRFTSDNECPEFPEDQLYVLFEFDYGGKDAEAFTFENARQAFCLVLQVAHILAVGEYALEFEHRDLHWGNILVEPTPDDNVSYVINGKTLTFPSCGIKARIIDFTIARMLNDELSPVFLDLKDDEEQFLGTGDHQFDIYRMMRDFNRNEWSAFSPKTNTFWTHYLADKLLNRGRYSSTDSVEHECFLRQLRLLRDRVMRYDSCTDFVLHKTCEDLAKLRMPHRMERRYFRQC